MVYLLFTSIDCKACPAMKRETGSLNLGHIEISTDNPIGAKIATSFQVRSLPTFIIVKGMEPTGELERIVGATSAEEIAKAVNRAKAKELEVNLSGNS